MASVGSRGGVDSGRMPAAGHLGVLRDRLRRDFVVTAGLWAASRAAYINALLSPRQQCGGGSRFCRLGVVVAVTVRAIGGMTTWPPGVCADVSRRRLRHRARHRPHCRPHHCLYRCPCHRLHRRPHRRFSPKATPLSAPPSAPPSAPSSSSLWSPLSSAQPFPP